MTMTDPFERAVAKEAKLRDRFDLSSRDSAMRLMAVFYGAITVVWGAVLLGHYLLAGADNIVFQVHAVVFAVVTALELVTITVVPRLVRRLDGNPRPPT
jgi:hypothetical protein